MKQESEISQLRNEIKELKSLILSQTTSDWVNVETVMNRLGWSKKTVLSRCYGSNPAFLYKSPLVYWPSVLDYLDIKTERRRRSTRIKTGKPLARTNGLSISK